MDQVPQSEESAHRLPPSVPAGAVAPALPLPAGRSLIRSQDLTSLPILQALLRERSVTRAGEAIGLSQPATSNALARLRRRFDDPLLVRTGREYELTPLGQSLLERADLAFEVLERLFEDTFDPGGSTREFTLALSDYTIVVLAGTLVPAMRRQAPHVRLNLRQLSIPSGDVHELLRTSDCVILPPDYLQGHVGSPLFRDRWVCLVGSQADVGDTVGVEDLARLPWVASFGPALFSSSPPVRQLRARGIEPRVEVSVEGFQAVPFLVAGTDRVAFIPELLAHRITDLAGLRQLPSPLPSNEHLLSLYWDPIDTNDPGHRWFREVLQCAATASTAQRPL